MSAKVYISGPMTGLPEANYPAFNAAAETLRSLDYEPLNPARHPAQDSWEEYLRIDLADVLAADALALLPGWKKSRGARLEVHVARELGMTVRPLAEWAQHCGRPQWVSTGFEDYRWQCHCGHRYGNATTESGDVGAQHRAHLEGEQ